ncbi:MAG: DUF3179 domain-containing protein [Gemmatimonadetes bacterium]|nr:DUF3179 domain-containing protein [Gemmatimonadota bacterium]
MRASTLGRRPCRRGAPAAFSVPALTVLLLGFAACGEEEPAGLNRAMCELDPELMAGGGPPPDGIPALRKPRMVGPSDPSLGYLEDGDRVLGVVIDGQARAYPHNILWWHEIINDTLGGRAFAVTFCPLTGSGLAFESAIRGRVIDFGVSGLLFANNLVMYDRGAGELYGPQLEVAGRCQGFNGVEPSLIPILETSWARWKQLHPDTRVVTGDLDFGRNYRRYPYGSYANLGNPELLFPMRIDQTRLAKERVLGIRVGANGGRGYPFGELADLGDVAAVNEEVDGRPIVVLYEQAAGETAAAYERRLNGRTLTFEAGGGGFRDRETGSRWDIGGRAVAGPLAGQRLRGVENAYVVFWFAWRAFQWQSTTFLVS